MRERKQDALTQAMALRQVLAWCEVTWGALGLTGGNKSRRDVPRAPGPLMSQE